MGGISESNFDVQRGFSSSKLRYLPPDLHGPGVIACDQIELIFHSTLSANGASVVLTEARSLVGQSPLPRQRRPASAGLRWCSAMVRRDHERSQQ
jgi:hypothetical protein